MPNVTPRPWRRVWISTRPSRGSNARPGRFCVNWLDDAGRKRRLAYRTVDAAQRAKALQEQALNAWLRPPGVRMWPELITEYGVSLADRSPAHRAKVARVLERFYRLCVPETSDQIGPAMCERFMADRAAGLPEGPRGPFVPSPATRRTERAMLAGFFRWCVDRGYMPSNPMAGVRPPPRPKRTARGPRPSEWIGLLRVLGNRRLAVYDPQGWHLLILLGVVTGFRQSVLLHCYFGVPVTDRRRLEVLERRHRADGGFSVVQLADTRDGIGLLHTFTGKTGKEGLVALPKVVTDRIAQRIGELPAGTERLFTWTRWQRKAWARITAAAGLAITFHTLRAVSGTRAAIARAERAAADQLEHSSPRVTRDHYLDAEQVARAVAVGQALPRLPALPRYGPRPVERSIPGRRPADSGRSGPPE